VQDKDGIVLLKKLKSVVARFWWGGDEKKRKIHWKKWEEIAIPKTRLVTKPDSLCAKVLKGKYFRDTDFMKAKRKRNASHTWNAILHGREALRKWMIKRVGDGTDIRVWEDPWIPATHSRLPVVRKPEANVTMVNELIDEDQLC
jgi:hypothetical protein